MWFYKDINKIILLCIDNSVDYSNCQNEAGGPPVKDRRHVSFAHRQPILSTPKFHQCNVFSTGYKPVEFRVFKIASFSAQSMPP